MSMHSFKFRNSKAKLTFNKTQAEEALYALKTFVEHTELESFASAADREMKHKKARMNLSIKILPNIFKHSTSVREVVDGLHRANLNLQSQKVRHLFMVRIVKSDIESSSDVRAQTIFKYVQEYGGACRMILPIVAKRKERASALGREPDAWVKDGK